MKISIRKGNANGKPRWVVSWKPRGGKRRRRFFRIRSTAEAEKAAIEMEFSETGQRWQAMTPAQRGELMRIYNEISSEGVSLSDVWAKYRQTSGVSDLKRRTLAKAIEETITAKKTANRRPRSVKALELYLDQFAQGREATFVDKIGPSEIESWFSGRKEAPSTRQSNLGRLSAMFELCWQRGYIRENPCRRVHRVSLDRRPPAILTLRQARKLMVYLVRHHPRGLAAFVLALFAGIRPEEIEKLSWDDIDLDREIVTIGQDVSKVRGQRRIVHLMPAATAWLRLGGDLPLPPITRRRYLHALRGKLGFLKWPQDILRHTCASYLLAVLQDAARVALELGNSPRVLLTHYRELVTREAAEKFWKIMPKERHFNRLGKKVPPGNVVKAAFGTHNAQEKL